MKKTMILLALVCSFAFIGTTALAQVRWGHEPGPGLGWSQNYGPGEGGSACRIYQPTAWDPFEASWLIGHLVDSSWAGISGQISDLVIDRANDRIALVILSDVPHMGNARIAIPYGALQRIGENSFQLNFGDDESSQVPPGFMYPSLYGIPSRMDSSWVTGVYADYGQTPYWTEAGMKPLSELSLYEADKLIGAEVQTPENKEVAQINDLVINTSDGVVALVVLSNVPGKADTLTAVPFSLLSKSSEKTYVLGTSEDKLAAAPSFNEETDMNNVKWAQDDFRYFGQQPCWSE